VSYLERVTPCDECAGTGEQPGKTWKFACRACYGTGKTRERFTPNYEAAWESYYLLADRRRKKGLTDLMLHDVVNAALETPHER
jgi:hypothetical protein